MKSAEAWLAGIACVLAVITNCGGESAQRFHDAGGSTQNGGAGGAGGSATGAGTGGSAPSGAGSSGSGGELAAGEGGTPPTEPSGAGSGGESASAIGGAAGEGGEANNPSQAGTGSGGAIGAAGSGGSSGSSDAGGAGGTGDTDPGPDPCEGIPAWDPAESWTEYEVGDQRVVNGELWHCQSPMFCHTYPGHPDAPGWFLDDECNDPGTGGEPACQCADGECCDGCYLLPRSHFCGEVPRYGKCNANGRLELDYWNLFCNGDATVCNRWAVHTKDTTGYCDQGTVCEEVGDMAACVPN